MDAEEDFGRKPMSWQLQGDVAGIPRQLFRDLGIAYWGGCHRWQTKIYGMHVHAAIVVHIPYRVLGLERTIQLASAAYLQRVML